MDAQSLIVERAILDIRPAQAFAQGHFLGAASHPLPSGVSAEELEQQLPSIFLPPRHTPLLVVAACAGEADRVARHLEARGRTGVEALAYDPQGLPPELLERGTSSRSLWQPPPYLLWAEPWLPPPAGGPALDLACGSGRAMVWLARRGYRTAGVDWQPEALELGRQLARHEGVRCRFQAGDLRKVEAVPRGPWSLILNFRYLQRDLLERLPALLSPGGVAIVRTFREAPGYSGHPHPRHRLQPGELLRAFTASSCDVLAHEEGFDPDGRPAAGVVVRRRTT